MYINPPTWESELEGPNLLVSSGGSDRKPAKSRASGIVPSQTPLPQTAPQWSNVGTPPWWIPKGSTPYNITGTLRQKNMAQMKEQIKVPEKIQLSDEEIANLSDTQFKTLVIKMLTEKVKYGHKI